MKFSYTNLILATAFLFNSSAIALSGVEMPSIVVAKDQKRFLLGQDGPAFSPWGFNYDHDENGRLIEDYWEAEWGKVERDFQAMKKLGANVVRVHLQLGKFMEAADKPNAKALARLSKLVKLAEDVGIYLDVTGLGCYHKADVPDWYDKLSEADRWNTQAQFWRSVAATCAHSPAIFCYDLMNEPVVPGGKRKDGDWLGPAFAGKHFVQVITLDQKDRPRPEIARIWIKKLADAIHEKDKPHLVTVGLVDWSLDLPGLSSGFVPEKIVGELDFICVHLYPESGKLEKAQQTLKGFSVGKPVLIEETFPLKCTLPEFSQFVVQSRKQGVGLIGFFWGKTPEDLRGSTKIHDVIVKGWLEFFQAHAEGKDRD